MFGPLIAKLRSLRELGGEPKPMDEMVIVMEIDLPSGMVLLQREDQQLYIYPFGEVVLAPEIKITRLAPAGPTLMQ